MIPRIIHQMFLSPDGKSPLSDDVETQCQSWRTHHPEFDYIFWDGPTFRGLCISFDKMDIYNAILKCKFPAMQVDVARLTILSCLGGFWADLKMVALRPFLEPLVDQHLVLAEHFVNSGWQPGIPCSAFLGGEPGHFFFDEALNQARERINSRWPKTLYQLPRISTDAPNHAFRLR